jgi:hypothetical protein
LFLYCIVVELTEPAGEPLDVAAMETADGDAIDSWHFWLEVVAAKTTKKESTICQPHSVLKDYLSRASAGIHSTWNEHFWDWSDGNDGHCFGYGGTRFGWAQVGYYCESLGFARVCKGLWWWWRRQKTYEMFGQHCGGVADAMYTIIKRGAGKEVAAIQQSGNRNASERFSDEVFMKSLKETMLILRC